MQHAHQVKRFLSMGNYNDSIKRSDNQDVGTAAKFSDDFLLPWTHWSLVLWVMWCWMTAHWTGWFEWQERHEGILSCEEQVVNSISLTSLPTKWHLILLYQYVNYINNHCWKGVCALTCQTTAVMEWNAVHTMHIDSGKVAGIMYVPIPLFTVTNLQLLLSTRAEPAEGELPQCK